ncbi:MAG: sensor histidine kinase [Clostridia bacterium]
MQKLRQSTLMKILCYLLIPVIAGILILSISNLIIVSEYGQLDDKNQYLETDNFGENYLYSIISKARYVKKVKPEVYEYGDYTKIEDDSYNASIYYNDYNYDNSSINSYINYIIIDEKTENLYTNIKSSDYIKEIQEMKNKKNFWNYEGGKITTNIDSINQDNAKYIIASYSQNYLEGVKVYSSFDEEAYGYSNSYYIQNTVYEMFKNNQNSPVYLIPITSVLLLAMIVYLVWAIGHEKGKDEIQLSGIDKVPYEILITIIFFALGIFVSLGVASVETIIPQKMLIPLIVISYLGSYGSLAVGTATTIKRLKAKSFWRSFLMYKIYAWAKEKVKKLFNVVSDKNSSKRKITIFYWGFIIVSGLIFLATASGVGVLLLLVFWVFVYILMLKYIEKVDKINQALKEIYEGNPNVHLEKEELTGVLKQMAEYINDIAGGFTNAIEQSLKSKRLKTELITNVSHDIKTPLTLIINYVDLLKQEDIKDEKIKQYIDILNQKSLRLKKLIEDLVEASKVSSGNVKLNIEVIDLKELLAQTIGEFEDRFENKNLKIDIEIPDEEVKIKADNRYMYRVIENLFSNITKYSIDNSRVYISLTKQNDKIKLEIKNISKDKLNISPDELMQRFVRGDKSRYTEGSGLGLSIAKSLTEMQDGKFDINIDGDLFKVIIEY